ncbi:WD40 repeat domain-containing protein [Acuticoccus mangrovi]|uniref:WD40 repeat domain-containing protein n=1 Tax=Acuticoccus mangrovi TaxID=2796142 RepID=A0A934MEY2_9HYPH|nr:WD40 repeat domain-containing protein [Acuticoccus mangrovi]MBJ3778062.1 WD40 repeat domain-containing protein [Acuticoccus mangrovi]
MQGGLSADLRTREGFPPTELERGGRPIETGAYVTAAVGLGDVVAAAHGNGEVRLFAAGKGAEPMVVPAHRGAVLAMARAGDDALVTGGDDGRFLRISAQGEVEEIASFGSRWVDCVAAGPATGLLACSAGKHAYVRSSDGGKTEMLEHPSTVGGLAFDRKGRLAVAHYGGVTVWERKGRRWTSTRLVWAGSHIGVSWSPDGKFVVTAMQENALHGWRLRDKADMRMSGYPSKARSVDWVGEVPYLVTSGADQAICWPFGGKDGPMGRGPLCVAYGGKQLATAVVGMPGKSAVLVGFQDGAVLFSELKDDVDGFVVRGSTGVEVTALAVTASHSHILIGDADGGLLWLPLDKGAHYAGAL